MTTQTTPVSPQGSARKYGVISVLDQLHQRAVGSLWEELTQVFDVDSGYLRPIAHLSYHLADGYDCAMADAILRDIAQSTPPFRIRTAGLGIFTGSSTVLFITIVRGPPLALLQQQLWDRLGTAAQNPVAHFCPEGWVPHITLGQVNLRNSRALGAVQWLTAQNLEWDVGVVGLAMARDTGRTQQLEATYLLGGEAAVTPPQTCSATEATSSSLRH